MVLVASVYWLVQGVFICACISSEQVYVWLLDDAQPSVLSRAGTHHLPAHNSGLPGRCWSAAMVRSAWLTTGPADEEWLTMISGAVSCTAV